MLTPKQEAFARQVASGVNHTDAYKVAYNTATMLPSTINNEAYLASRNPDIAKRVEQLLKEAAEASRLSPDFVVSKLIHVVETALTPQPILHKGEDTGFREIEGDVARAALVNLGQILQMPGLVARPVSARDVAQELLLEIRGAPTPQALPAPATEAEEPAP